MRRALLSLIFLVPVPGCMEEPGEAVDAGAEWTPTTEIAERDQAPEAETGAAPDELPVFDWQPDAAKATGPGGVCWGDNALLPGCQKYPDPANECTQGSSCNTIPFGNGCGGRCGYGWACTANCSSSSPTFSNIFHASCNSPGYAQYAVGSGVRYYNPGPDKQCGTGDDPSACLDGKNPGLDGRCDPVAGGTLDTDNY